jgi:hypothetical protein
MPRYFFHFESHGVRVQDEVGLALPDLEAAWYQAVRSGRDLIHAETTIGCSWEGRTVEIADETGIRERVPLLEIARFADSV